MRLAKVLQLNREEREKFFVNLKTKGTKLVTLLCYCYMPNHFHFLLKQNEDGGITRFLSNFTNSYTKYFNTKHKRNGPLFQGTFKAVRIEDDNQLLHVTRYIHLNPLTSYLLKEKDLDSYPWSSYPEYWGNSENNLCEKAMILSNFSSKDQYRKFISDQVEYAKSLEAIKHLVFDEE